MTQTGHNMHACTQTISCQASARYSCCCRFLLQPEQTKILSGRYSHAVLSECWAVLNDDTDLEHMRKLQKKLEEAYTCYTSENDPTNKWRPGHWEISPAQKALEEKRLLARRGIDSVMDEVYAVLKPIRSAVDKAKVASVGMIKQDLAEHEEKHGMDHPSIARLAWKLGKCLEGNDREAMLIRAATALIECPGTAHEMTYMCLSDLCSVSRQTLQAMAAGLVAGTTYWWNKTDEGFVDNPMLSEVLMYVYDTFECQSYTLSDKASLITTLLMAQERLTRVDHRGQGVAEHPCRHCAESDQRIMPRVLYT